MTMTRQVTPTTKSPHFATLLVMALAPAEIGARIKQRREELGLTHQQLADAMDVELRTVQRWQEGVSPKTGKSSLPRLATLMKLADVMDVEQAYFVEQTVDSSAVAEAPWVLDLRARLEALSMDVAETRQLVSEALGLQEREHELEAELQPAQEDLPKKPTAMQGG